jgi:hypothetical protein
MWPHRPRRLTDVFSRDDLRRLLLLGDTLGSAVSCVEKGEGDTFETIDPPRAGEDRRPDPFCSFFRHGRVQGKPAFDGADEACAQCELRFARRVLSPPAVGALEPGEHGTYRLRCHMGLTDFQAPVSIAGHLVAGLIAGRRVEAEEDRQRVRKTAGKLGKLTRAEAGIEGAGDRLVTPADEKCRERLLQEIGSIPIATGELEKGLAELGRLLGRLGTRYFEGTRRAWEDALVERIDLRHGEPPATFADLRRDLGRWLDSLRQDLEMDYLAFFAMTPKELDDTKASASLVAESGLGANTGRRILELDWSKFPQPATGAAEVARGLGAVSSAIRALVETRDSPPGLKDRLTKCLFIAPVEFGPHLRAALAFGPARSPTPPEQADFLFLARLGRAVARNYYGLAAEIERRWLSGQLENVDGARREAETARRELERTEGFTFFDARKALNQCLERVAGRARERGVELDTRDTLERLTFRGDRQRIAALIGRLLEEGVERTLIDPETKKGAPLRVFLKRSRTRLFLGVEAIGRSLEPGERRQLFPQEAAAAETSPAAAVRPLTAEQDTVRRHQGRLRVDCERLHKWERDRSVWVAKTTFLVDLPLPARPEPERGPPDEAREPRGRPRNERAPRPAPAVVTAGEPAEPAPALAEAIAEPEPAAGEAPPATAPEAAAT